MGIPALGTVGTPPPGDQANAYVAGQFSGIGPGPWLGVNGAFNCTHYASINTSLTTTKGSLAATLGSGTGLAAGASVKSINVPAGTVLGSLSTLLLPTIQLTGFIAANGQISGLAETANLLGATVSGPPAAGLAAGSTVQSIVTPAIPGISTGTVQLSLPPAPTAPINIQQTFNLALSDQCITSGTDTAAQFTGAGVSYTGTVQLEKSFDGGQTAIVCGVGGGGQLAQYTNGTPVSFVAAEPEGGVLYRWNCIAYSSGTINHRLSTTSPAATAWGIPPS